MILDEFGRDYLRLALAIDQHIEGYIDAYYGPADLKSEVEASDKQEPAALLDEVGRLQAVIPSHDPKRHAYLSATLRAIECTVRMLNGESFAYLDEVGRLYDIQPQQVDEAQFEAAHRELDRLLPGTGPIVQRVQAHQGWYEVGPSQVLPLLELVRTETRRRTADFIALPDHEQVEVRLTSNQPWGAYNWYLGNGRSLIEFNTDVPIRAIGLIGTFAHEGYPGHHTEAVLKEKHLYQEKGYAEQAVMLLHSPAAVIAEGIATTALEIIFPDSSHHQWNIEVLLPAASLSPDVTAEEMQRIAQASKALRYVTGNAAIRYHTGQLNEEQTVEYIQTYNLVNQQRARKSFSFISHPLYRSYVFTYTQGYDLITQAAGSNNKTSIFHRLLTEQYLPSQLTEGGQ